MISAFPSTDEQRCTLTVYDKLPTLIPSECIAVLNWDLGTCRVFQREAPSLFAEAQFFSHAAFQQLDFLLQACKAEKPFCPYELLYFALFPSTSSQKETLQRIQQDIQKAAQEKRVKDVLDPVYNTLQQRLEKPLKLDLGWRLVTHFSRGISLERLEHQRESPWIKHYVLEDSGQRHVYAYHSGHRTLTPLVIRQAVACSFSEIQFTSREAYALRSLFECFPHYAPLNQLLASVQEANQQGDTHQSQHQLQKNISSLRHKLGMLPLSITCERSLGYTLHLVSKDEEDAS